jgi:hypothetical protein
MATLILVLSGGGAAVAASQLSDLVESAVSHLLPRVRPVRTQQWIGRRSESGQVRQEPEDDSPRCQQEQKHRNNRDSSDPKECQRCDDVRGDAWAGGVTRISRADGTRAARGCHPFVTHARLEEPEALWTAPWR